MLNKIFWKKSNNSNNQNNKKLFWGLWNLSKKVVDTLKIAPVAIAGILAWCSSISDNNQVDIEQNLDNTNGWYTLESEGNNKIDLDKIATKSDILDALWPVIIKDEFGNLISDIQEVETETLTYKEFHITKKWEWFHSIARSYWIDVYELIALNKDDLEDIDNIPVWYKVKLGNLVMESNDSQSFNIDTSVESTYTQTDTQVNVVNTSIESEPVKILEIDEKKQINIESNNVNITKTYEVSEGENLYWIARKTGVPYKKLKSFNSFLRRFDEEFHIYKYVVYPTKKIFLEEPNLDSNEYKSIVEDYNNHVADIKNHKEWKDKYLEKLNEDYRINIWTENYNDTAEINKDDIEVNDEYIRHRIISDDNLSDIADKYYTTVDELIQINGLDKNRFLQLGWILRVPRVDSPEELLRKEKEAYISNVKNFLIEEPNKINRILRFAEENFPKEFPFNPQEQKYWLLEQRLAFKIIMNINDKILQDKLISYLSLTESELKYRLAIDSSDLIFSWKIDANTLHCWKNMRKLEEKSTWNDVPNSNMHWYAYDSFYTNSELYFTEEISHPKEAKVWGRLVYDRFDSSKYEWRKTWWNFWNVYLRSTGKIYLKRVTNDRFKYWHADITNWNWLASYGVKRKSTWQYPKFSGWSFNTNIIPIEKTGFTNKVHYPVPNDMKIAENGDIVSKYDQIDVNYDIAQLWEDNDNYLANNTVNVDEQLSRTRKYVKDFANVQPTIENADYVLHQLSVDNNNASECLLAFWNKCLDILKLQKKAWQDINHPVTQEYVNLYRTTQRLKKYTDSKKHISWNWVLKISAE